MEKVYKFELNQYENQYFMPYISDLKDYIDFDDDLLESCINLIEESFDSKCVQFNHPSNIVLLKKDGIIVATVFISPCEGSNTDFNIYNVCTHKNYRKRGYMTDLIYTAIDLARASQDIGDNNNYYLDSEQKNLCIYIKLFDIVGTNGEYYKLKYKNKNK